MDYKKMSAAMAALVENYHSNRSMAVANGLQFASLSQGHQPGSPPLVHLFLRCAPQATLDQSQLQSNGIVVHQTQGRVRTALAPLDKIERLSEEPDVERIAPAKKLRPLLDKATVRTNVTTFKTNSSLTGKDVIVGIVDSGVDAAHSMFAGRILSIWDQNIPGAGWSTTNYGTVLSGATLSMGTDQNGHGTHVSGIAAGNDATFLGLAHEADLIVVKTNFNNTGIADGVRYIFEQARALNRPAVVNLSLGGHSDAHDGSDDLSEAINQECGPGRIVVAAAGNEGTDAIHGAATVPANSQIDLPFQVTPSTQSGAAPWIVLNGWYPGNGNCRIGIRTSTGATTTLQAVIPTGSPVQNYSVVGAQIQVSTPPPTVNPNGDHQFFVEIRPAAFSSTVQGGSWTLSVENRGAAPCRIDVWSIVPEGANPAGFSGPAAAADMKIGSPGCAASVVTVGAFTTRNSWTIQSGATQSVGLSVDDICDFSSPGPLRNSARKPDVTAPGAMIISALSTQSSPDNRYIVAPTFRVDAGTSMASPFVAGLIALLLQRNSLLDPNGVKALLQQNSRVPGMPPGTYNDKWGFGLIDALGL